MNSSYYVYGRLIRTNGYVSINPDYPAPDEAYFKSMAEYPKERLAQQFAAAAGASADEVEEEFAKLPEKLFFYQFHSKEKGPSVVFGRTSYIRGSMSQISDRDHRDVFFSFQHLLGGDARRDLLRKPSRLCDLTPFPVKMDDIHRPGDGEQVLTPKNAVLDVSAFQRSGHARKLSPDAIRIEDLLQDFSLAGEKLEEFLYTLLMSGTREKVYLLLPEGPQTEQSVIKKMDEFVDLATASSTDRAFALMCRVLEILPPVLVGRNGFLTYAKKGRASGTEDYVPFEIRYVFLADSEENRSFCKNAGGNYVFAPGCDSGVRIPKEMRALTREMAESLLKGEPVGNYRLLAEALQNYLQEDFPQDIALSPLIYRTIYNFSVGRQMLAEGMPTDQFPPQKELWQDIDLLRKMIAQQGQLWQPRMLSDLTQYEKDLIDSDVMDGTDGYGRLFQEYEGVSESFGNIYGIQPEFCENIVQYFCRRIGRNYSELQEYIQILEACPSLKLEVSARFVEILLEKLKNGDLEASMYMTVLEMYADTPELQEAVPHFFAGKIVSAKTFKEYQEFLLSHGGSKGEGKAIWEKTEREIYGDSEKFGIVLEIQIELAANVLRAQKENPQNAMVSFWNCIKHAKEHNEAIVSTPVFIDQIRGGLRETLTGAVAWETISKLLLDAQNKIRELGLPQKYRELFGDLSREYLKNNCDRICRECMDRTLFDQWPFVEQKDTVLVKIRRGLEQRQREEDTLYGFEKTIENSTAPMLVNYFRNNAHQETIQLAGQSGNLPKYVRKITDKLELEVEAKGKGNLARECYDDLCVRLLLAFPDRAGQVFDYVMHSVYGGVTAMSSIRSKLNKLPELDRWDRSGPDMSNDYDQEMAESIRTYFRNNKMCRRDKLSIKEETRFLEHIGLDANTLLAYGKR
ncbi:MAG: hypothetical protein LUF35_08755 [Lachnospiraceae bacterium]|nr:hypothetical protein [Lachnospiraceae bacterium]